MDELKPCPFCGGDAVIRKDEERIKPFYVRCGNINCKMVVGTNYFATKEEAIEAWNRRASNTDVISKQVAIDAVLELDASHRVSWKDAVIDTIDALSEKRTDKRTETHGVCSDVPDTNVGDTISRQAAIELIENESRKWGDEYEISDVLCDLSDMPSAQQWIPVSSGNLPGVRQRVLCQCQMGIQVVLRLTDDGDWECIYPPSTYMKSFVIAWMPLPSPYKEVSE